MATTRPKLWLKTSRIRILNIVTFLMLSAVAVANEANSTHQCFWCGPIAEQVHRSEVAPPCGPQNTVVFNCQEGHNFCAIAASSPPYVESRFCSKVYQDECYPQYCNSTKKWRMTCTCRGSLCNENITKRETEAFAKLPRKVEAKESREKRETQNANFILSDKEKTVIIKNVSAVHSEEVEHSTTDDDSAESVESDLRSNPKVIVHIISNDEELVTDAPQHTDTIENKGLTNNVSNKYNDSDDDADEMDILKPKQNEITETSVKAVLLSKVIIGTTKMTKPNEDVMNTNTPRPSEKLPSAEALQQDASSENDHDNTEHTTVDYEPTESGTADGDDDDDDNNHPTTESSQTDESSAHINKIDMLLLLNGLMLQFIYNRK